MFMLSNGNGNTNTLTGFYCVDLKKKKKKEEEEEEEEGTPISFKSAYQGRKDIDKFRCRQKEPEIILFAVCRVLN